MSRIRANQITNQSADGAPTVQHGLIIAGVSTFTGSVSIGGTLTYEDVTNIDSIGIVTARGGIHIDDSIVHIGDTNTKIRFPVGDVISAETNGAERLRITSTGSVGIGTNNPDVGNTAYPVVQVHGTSTNAYFKLTNTTTGVGSGDGVELSLSGSDAYLTNRESASIIFRTGGSNERLRITSSGKLLVGTSSDYAENVQAAFYGASNGGIALASGTSGSSRLMFADGTSGSGTGAYIGSIIYAHSDNSMRFTTNTNERLRITSDGAVSWKSGTTPLSGTGNNYSLNIYRDSGGGYGYFDVVTSGSNHTGVRIRAYHNGTYNNVFEHNTNDYTSFSTGGSERLRIDSNGSVGINIANPGSYDPNAESLVVGEISGGDGNSGITIVSGATDKQGAIYFADGTASASYRGRVEYNHNTDILGLGAGGSGYMYELTSDRILQSQNFCINSNVAFTSSSKYSQINSDNHANTFLGINCRLGTSGSSGNHKIIQSNSHGSIGCAGILMGGNGSNNNSRIAFFAFPQGNSGGHDFGQDAWRMRINKDGDMIEVKTPQNSGNAGMIIFRDGNHDFCGQITSNGANNTTSYNTSSDYRLKTNEALITDGITRIKNLKPYQFEWKSDLGTKVDGFFAHEAQTVVPESVVGTKDEVDSDNNPVYQGIDQSKLVPLLTAALQEAITKIETLEAEVAALKSS